MSALGIVMQADLPGPGDLLRAALSELPLPQVGDGLLLAGGVGMILALGVAHQLTFGALSSIATRSAQREGYALPLSIRETHGRAIGRISKLGNVVEIPRTGSILALGASRSGKTEAAKHIVDQMRADESEPMVVYDHKEDYQTYLSENSIPYDRLSTRGSDLTWNIFREIDGPLDADEISRAIFADSGETTYFDRAGRQVFAALLKILHRNDGTATNADLVALFEGYDRKTLYEQLSEEDDMAGAASHLDPESSRSASNVYASVQERVDDLFIEDFAKEPDEGEGFSIREYMHNPEGRAIVLDYPYREGATTTPLFRLLIDLAAREALDDGDRGSYFILDEIAQVPALSRLDELVNVGAGRDIQVLVTLQSVAQLREGYGRDASEAILSGFLSAIILRCADGPSIEFARDRIGTKHVERTANVEKVQVGSRNRRRQKTMRRETKPSEEHPFAKGEISEWRPGEGVVVRPDSWAHGRIQLLD